jgi:hypothetical protein
MWASCPHVTKLPAHVSKLPGGPMQYKTIVGPADLIDQDVNHLANEGWLVHSFIVVGATDTDPDDPECITEIPILAYLMLREAAPQVETESGRPVRKVLGGKQL